METQKKLHNISFKNKKKRKRPVALAPPRCHAPPEKLSTKAKQENELQIKYEYLKI